MISALSTNTMEAQLEGSGAVVPVTKLYGGKALQRTERPEVFDWEEALQRTERPEVFDWEEATAFLIELPDKTVALIEMSAIDLLDLDVKPN